MFFILKNRVKPEFHSIFYKLKKKPFDFYWKTFLDVFQNFFSAKKSLLTLMVFSETINGRTWARPGIYIYIYITFL